MRFKTRINIFQGIQCVGDPIDIPEGACQDQLNVISEPLTTSSTRCGFTKYTTSELSGNAIGIFGYYDKTDTLQILQWTSSGKIIKGTSES